MSAHDSTTPDAEPIAPPLPDWDALAFRFHETDWIYVCHGARGGDWPTGEFRPFGPVTLEPSASFFSYGLGIFEGLKAHRARDGRVLLFRHRDHAKRFQRSAERLMLAPFPEDAFAAAVEGIVRRNLRFVPPHGKGAFYVRPLEHAIERRLGLLAPEECWVLIFGCPVGGYFAKRGGLRLKVLERGRCAPGGTGAAKAIGNYAGTIATLAMWKEQDYSDVLYLDARHERNVTETSGSNVFARLRDGKLVTPPLGDEILAGITRDSVIRLAREVCGVEVEERTLPLEEVLEQAEEVFCTGTAWTVQSIRELDYRGQIHTFEGNELAARLLDVLRGIQLGEREDRYGWVTEVHEG